MGSQGSCPIAPRGGEVDRSTQWLTVGWSAAPTESAGSRPLTTTRRWENINYAALGTKITSGKPRGKRVEGESPPPLSRGARSRLVTKANPTHGIGEDAANTLHPAVDP